MFGMWRLIERLRSAKSHSARRSSAAVSLIVEELEHRNLPSLLGQTIFPDASGGLLNENPWNQDISAAPVSGISNAVINAISVDQVAHGKPADAQFHPDFGQDDQTSNPLYGIPYNVANSSVTTPINVIISSASESDVVAAPLPSDPTLANTKIVIEGDFQNGPNHTLGYGSGGRGDSHLLLYDTNTKKIFEFFNTSRPSENADGKWHADSEAVFDTTTNSFHTLGYTSADAAGLSILAGLIRPDEVITQGAINHAIRFTLDNPVILDQYLYPASHIADPGNTDPTTMPPMGARFRLKNNATVNALINNMQPESKVIALAMQKYGLIVADNGSNLFASGASYSVNADGSFGLTWNDNDIQSTSTGLKALHMSDFEMVDLTPKVTSLGTTSGPAGTSVVIHGLNFSGSASNLHVFFGAGNAAASFTVDSDSQITAVAPAGSGTVDITVQSGSNQLDHNTNQTVFWGYGTSATSAADRFTYTASTGPTVTAVNPTAGPLAGGTSVTITGTNFTGATGVSFGGTAGTGIVVNSATQITVTAPAHAAGQVDVTVTTPGGTSATSASDHYTYLALPTVTGVSPVSGPTAGGTSVTITGTNFVAGATVSFGGTAGTSVVVNSAIQITVTAPARAAGQIDVTVTTPGGTSATNASDHYTYLAPPTVTAVSPASGPTAGGTSVTITGTNFVAGATVSFGGTAGTSVVVNSATQITVTAPARTAGQIDVTVTTPGGTSAANANDHYTYLAPPTVTAVTPSSGPTAGGTSVTITGTNFVAGATVSFGGTAGASVVVNSATQITVTAPAHASTMVDVTVTTSNGSSATSSADHFTYVDFADNFNQANGALSSSWFIPQAFAPVAMRFQYRRQVQNPTSFKVSGNVAVGQGTAASSIAAEQVAGLSLLNPTVQADVTLGSASAIGLFARAQSNGDAYVAVLISGKAQIWLYHGASGSFNVLGSATYTATPPTTIKFTVTGSGTSTTLSLTDGTGNPLLPAVTGSTLTTLNTGGGPGIFAQGIGGTVDNFSATGS
jgi:hypothetical protein